MRNRTLVTAALAATMLVGSFATASAHHRTPALDFLLSDGTTTTEVDAGTAVDVRASATQDSNSQAREAALDRCLDAGGIHVASELCDADGQPGVANTDGFRWVELGFGEPFVIAAPTNTGGVFGYRARIHPNETDTLDRDAHYETGDLTVNTTNETQRHNACNGIEKANDRVQNNNASAKAKEKLAEHADKFGCDIDED